MDGTNLTFHSIRLNSNRRYSDRDVHQHLFNELLVENHNAKSLDTKFRGLKLRSEEFQQGVRESLKNAMERFQEREVPCLPAYEVLPSEYPHNLDDLLEAERSLFAQELEIALADQATNSHSDDYNEGAVFAFKQHEVPTLALIRRMK